MAKKEMKPALLQHGALTGPESPQVDSRETPECEDNLQDVEMQEIIRDQFDPDEKREEKEKEEGS
jgi:hypothetical protein